MTDFLIIPKHGGDELRVGLGQYNGHSFLSMRVFYTALDGDKRPGKQGCTVPLRALDDLRDAIDRIQARTRGPALATVTSLAAHRARQAATGPLDDCDVIDSTDGGAA